MKRHLCILLLAAPAPALVGRGGGDVLCGGDGGARRRDTIWNVGPRRSHRDATMTCGRLEVWRGSGPWC